MGGTDLHDMRIAFIRSTVKSRRWQVRVLTDMFSSMLMNPYVLRQSHFKLPKSYSSFDFISEFLQEICPDEDKEEQTTSTPLNTPRLPPRRQPHADRPHPAGYDNDGNVRRGEAPFWNSRAGTDFRLDGHDHWCQDANNIYHPLSTRTNKDGKIIRNELRRKCRWCNAREDRLLLHEVLGTTVRWRLFSKLSYYANNQ